MDAGTLQVDDEIGKEATGLVNALAGQSWIAAAIAAIALAAALVKKFGVGKKKVEPKVHKSDEDLDKAADEARALMSMKDKE